MKTIGIIGCGNMGVSLLRALKQNEARLEVCDQDKAKLNAVCKKFSLTAAKSNEALIKISDVIIIAVKPQDVDSVLYDIEKVLALAGNAAERSKLIISIAAGITTKYIEKIIKNKIAVVRAMPNLAAMINESMSAVAKGKYAKSSDLNFAEEIFSTVGETIIINEKLIDLITAISGSGPAYFFYLMECLEKAAIKGGIKKADARKLATQTALGAAGMALVAKSDIEELRKKVTSKGGTTQAALKVFKKKNLDKIIQQAVKAAKNRAKELSRV